MKRDISNSSIISFLKVFRPFKCDQPGCVKEYYRKHELINHEQKCHKLVDPLKPFYKEEIKNLDLDFL